MSNPKILNTSKSTNSENEESTMFTKSGSSTHIDSSSSSSGSGSSGSSSRSSNNNTARVHSDKLRMLAAGIIAVALCSTPTTASTTTAADDPTWTPCTSLNENRRYSSPPTAGRERCMQLLPREVVEADPNETWLIAVHVDRAPSGSLRGGSSGRRLATHRELPHQYFATAMKATLDAIAKAEPGAAVNLVVFSEGYWGEMVDEQGVPIDWDIAGEICENLELQCTQNLVLLNSGRRDIVPEALECIGAADVFVSSEDEFSQAAELLSDNVKVLTDRWQMDRSEKMVALNVANTIAGMADNTRAQLFKIVKEWRECSLSYA